ncbi:MAG: flagellar biosynthesis anti-sigma factor FlgM [Pseudomonadota bacterium]|jgi:negative regulator of flagellin synthesis FlgM
MSNKIEGPRLASLPPPSTAEAADRKARGGTEERVGAPAPADSVRLTGAGSEIAAVSRTAGEAAPFDSARVDRVRAAIADGTFRVDTRLVADRLLASEKDLPR